MNKAATALALELSILGCELKSQAQLDKEACQRELSSYNREILHVALRRAANGNCIDSSGTTIGLIEELELADSSFCSSRDAESLKEFREVMKVVKAEVSRLCPPIRINFPKLSFEPAPPPPKFNYRGKI